MSTSFLMTGKRDKQIIGAPGAASRKPEFSIDVVFATMTVEML